MHIKELFKLQKVANVKYHKCKALCIPNVFLMVLFHLCHHDFEIVYMCMYMCGKGHINFALKMV